MIASTNFVWATNCAQGYPGQCNQNIETTGYVAEFLPSIYDAVCLISSTSGKKNHPVTYVSFIFATALAFSTPGNMISLFGYRKKYE